MSKKENNLIIRVNSDIKTEFKNICNSYDTTLSCAICSFMQNVIDSGKFPKQISDMLEKKPAKKLDIITIKKSLFEVLNSYSIKKVKKVYLFGSYSRGEETINSDIDLLLDVDNHFTLFDQSAIVEDMKIKTGKNIDVVTSGGISEEFKNEIKKDLICIYERD